jgi:hypothetical protein
MGHVMEWHFCGDILNVSASDFSRKADREVPESPVVEIAVKVDVAIRGSEWARCDDDADSGSAARS